MQRTHPDPEFWVWKAAQLSQLRCFHLIQKHFEETTFLTTGNEQFNNQMISGTTGFLLSVSMQLKELAGGAGGHGTLIWDASNWSTGHLGFRSSFIPNLWLWQVSLLDQMIVWASFPVVLLEQFCNNWTANHPTVSSNPSSVLVLWLSSFLSSICYHTPSSPTAPSSLPTPVLQPPVVPFLFSVSVFSRTLTLACASFSSLKFP